MLLRADIMSGGCTQTASLSRTIKKGDTLLGIAVFVFYHRECGRWDSPYGEFRTFPSLRIGKFKIGTGGVHGR